MGKTSSKKKLADLEAANTAAHRIVALTTGEKNPAAVALGKLGASKGGKARAATLTASARSAIAKKAAQARWKKK